MGHVLVVGNSLAFLLGPTYFFHGRNASSGRSHFNALFLQGSVRILLRVQSGRLAIHAQADDLRSFKTFPSLLFSVSSCAVLRSHLS